MGGAFNTRSLQSCSSFPRQRNQVQISVPRVFCLHGLAIILAHDALKLGAGDVGTPFPLMPVGFDQLGWGWFFGHGRKKRLLRG